jgi:hypothetical protein
MDIARDKEKILDRLQDYNDDLGSQMLDLLERNIANYKQGVIHHEELAKNVKNSAEQFLNNYFQITLNNSQ